MTGPSRAAFSVACLLLATSTSAQSRVVDSYDSVWSPSSGSAQWQLYAGRIIVVDVVTRDSATASSQILWATGMHALPPERCLFCGRDAAGNGRIELWEFTGPDSLTLRDSRIDVGRRYEGIALAAESLFLLDSRADVLLSGEWNSTSDLADVDLSIAARPTTPNFPDAGDWTLTAYRDGSVAMVPFPVGGGILVIPGTEGQASLESMTHGHPEARSDGTRVQPYCDLGDATAGGTLHVRLAWKAPRPRSSDARYSGCLLIAFRDPIEPVVRQPGGRYHLTPALTAPEIGGIPAGSTQGGISVAVPIPLALEEAVLLAQFVILDEAELRWSRIYGAEIE